MNGWHGRYLRVDAGSGEARSLALDPGALAAVIGGVGLGALLLLRETPAGLDPLGPEAAVIFAFGPLGGTPLTTSAKLAVVAKSPLTGRLNDALTGSDLAISGKRTGHDAIVITGRAAAPSVLLIDGERARLEPAGELWDRDLPLGEAEALLGARFPGFDFAVIGTAGERGVRYAGLGNGGRHAGRGGTGAVLGSKRLKAVGFRGERRTDVADAARVLALARDLADRSLGPGTEKYRELGTVANLAALNRIAALPTRNFQGRTFAAAPALSGEELRRTRAAGRGSCAGCTIGCEHFFAAGSGRGAVKAEYENVFALGPLCGIEDPEVVLAASRACDELGLDTISAGGTIALAMELGERGLLPGAPRFGDGPGLLALLDAIAHRRGPLGDLLAEGSRRAAERLGPPAPDLAPHVKGLEIPGYEPRALQTAALGFAVAARGADHNRSGAYEADLSGKTDRLAPDPEAARLAVETEDRAAVMDSLVLCKFLRGAIPDLFAESAAMLEAVSGAPVDAARMRAAARRIVLLRRLFNEREGWTLAEDTLPARFFAEALPDGPARGAILSRERLAAMIAVYHEARGLRADGTLTEEARAALADLYRGAAPAC
jgi:aldehyde:ferredoxin oxidoreductase